jgi:hypothetical protein
MFALRFPTLSSSGERNLGRSAGVPARSEMRARRARSNSALLILMHDAFARQMYHREMSMLARPVERDRG